jgi:hypothetical protein
VRRYRSAYVATPSLQPLEGASGPPFVPFSCPILAYPFLS